MKEALIIADVAGQFDALMRLVARVDTNMPIIGVGDLPDRGPDSASVIDWFMRIERADSVKGNHEDMMVDHLLQGGKYQKGVWLMNGGGYTLRSYDEYSNGVPSEHIDWLASRKMSLMIPRVGNSPGCLITHGPLHRKHTLNSALFLDDSEESMDYTLLWNRTEPVRRDWFQVFGHNAHWGLRTFSDAGQVDNPIAQVGAWAICIDQSRRDILTGFHWPSGEIFEECYDASRKPELSP